MTYGARCIFLENSHWVDYLSPGKISMCNKALLLGYLLTFLWWLWKGLCSASHTPFYGLCCLPLTQSHVFMARLGSAASAPPALFEHQGKGITTLLCASFPHFLLLAQQHCLAQCFNDLLLCRLDKTCTLSWYISVIFSLHFLHQELDMGHSCDDHKETKSMFIHTLCCLVFQLFTVTGYESSEFVCSFNFLVVSSFPSSGSILQIQTSSLLNLIHCSNSTYFLK